MCRSEQTLPTERIACFLGHSACSLDSQSSCGLFMICVCCWQDGSTRKGVCCKSDKRKSNPWTYTVTEENELLQVFLDPGPDTDTQEEGDHVEAMLRQECSVALTKKTGEASLWGEEAVKEDDEKLT